MANAPRALVIEDDFDIAEIFGKALASAGFEIEIIYDGNVAMHRLFPRAGDPANPPPDVIALDLHLPGISGVEILKAIRTDEELSPTRVILVTADQALAQSIDDEADLVLLKPVSFTQLQLLAQRIIEKPRRPR